MLAVEDPRIEARRQVARLRTAPGPEKVAQEAQAAEFRAVRENLVDRFGNRRFFVAATGLEQAGEPVADKGAVDRIVRQPQRVEAGRSATGDPLVAAAERTQEDLRAAVLVEQ